MLKKAITYTDYNGTERTESFYFNLNKAELMDMELGTVGGMRQLLQNILDKQDIPKIIDAFKTIIFKAYGEKSPDGRRFIKSPALSEAFSQTEAYSELYMSLISDAKAAAAFINGIMPAEIADKINANETQAEAEKKEENNGNANLLSNITPMH